MTGYYFIIIKQRKSIILVSQLQFRIPSVLFIVVFHYNVPFIIIRFY